MSSIVLLMASLAISWTKWLPKFKRLQHWHFSQGLSVRIFRYWHDLYSSREIFQIYQMWSTNSQSCRFLRSCIWKLILPSEEKRLHFKVSIISNKRFAWWIKISLCSAFALNCSFKMILTQDLDFYYWVFPQVYSGWLWS